MEQKNIIIYKTVDSKASIALYTSEGDVWLNLKQLAKLFATYKSSISEHITNILKDMELDENSVVRKFRTTAADSKIYDVFYYALPMIQKTQGCSLPHRQLRKMWLKLFPKKLDHYNETNLPKYAVSIPNMPDGSKCDFNDDTKMDTE